MQHPAILALFVVTFIASVWALRDAWARLLRRTGFRAFGIEPLRVSTKGFNPSRGEL